VLPDGSDDRGDVELRRPARVPERRDRENREGRDTGHGDSHGAPPEAEEKKRAGHGALDDAPAERPIRPSDGEMDPPLGAVEERDTDADPEDSEAATRLLPRASHAQADQIVPDQSRGHSGP